LTERTENRTVAVCISQLASILKNISDVKLWKDLVISYEPVWAIETDKTASPEQAQEVHLRLREWLAANVSKEVALETRIIYRGSVTEVNAKELITQSDFDGFLVGPA